MLYNSDDIKRQMLMGLESICIIQTSNAIDTLCGRLELLTELYFKNNLYVYVSNERYISDMQEAIDHYKQVYYDRIITIEQQSYLQNPTSTTFHQIFILNIERAMKFWIDKLYIEIEKSKSERSKIKKIDKLFELQRLALRSASNCKNANQYDYDRVGNWLLNIPNQLNNL